MKFWFQKEVPQTLNIQQPSVAVAEPDTPHPSPAEIDEDMDEEYLRVAQEVGVISSPAIKSEMLVRLLREENIGVYDSVAVYKYLDKKLGTNWHWMALREQDYKPFDRGTWNWDSKPFRSGPYHREVPLAVLLSVQKISAKFPDTYFFVSEPGRADDPFLMVTTGGRSKCFIIERWDEPGFRQ